MRFLVIAGSLAVALMLATPAGAQTLYTCGAGTVRAVEAVAGNEITPVVREIADQSQEGSIVTEIVFERKPIAYLVTVQLRDNVYTARAAAGVPWNFDPTSLAVDDAVLVCANDRQMVIDRLDGTDYRASIVSVALTSKPVAGR